MTAPIRHLNSDAVLAIHAEVLSAHGGASGIRDRALLESAVAGPQASVLGQPAFTDPIDIAAAYLFYLCQNHPFTDGNKRTALATCLVFLAQNKRLPEQTLDADSWESFVMDVASSRLDREQTTARLRSLLSKGAP